MLLITDGNPTGCSTNAIADVDTIVATAYGGTDPLKTFVIGVGSSLTSLNEIAVSGGTKAAYVLDTTADVGQTFKTALEQIRREATGCTFALTSPSPSLSGNVDLVVTNVTGSQTPIPRTSDGTAATCESGMGWYPTHPGSQTSVNLCANSCASASAGSLAVPGNCGSL